MSDLNNLWSDLGCQTHIHVSGAVHSTSSVCVCVVGLFLAARHKHTYTRINCNEGRNTNPPIEPHQPHPHAMRKTANATAALRAMYMNWSVCLCD